MSKYTLRTLIETVQGKQFSYMTVEGNSTSSLSQSFFNSDNDTNAALSSSTAWNRITGSLSCSFQNDPYFSASADQFLVSKTLKNNIYLSSSLVDGLESGSIQFITTGATGSDNDRLRRIKFLGEKSCTSLGIAEGFWYFSDEFRLVSGSERHYFRGDVVADSLYVINDMAISNAGRITSDIPIRVDKETDIFCKWILTSGSTALHNDLLIGYNDELNQYWISASDHPDGDNPVEFNIGGVSNLSVDSLTYNYITEGNTVGYISTDEIRDADSSINMSIEFDNSAYDNNNNNIGIYVSEEGTSNTFDKDYPKLSGLYHVASDPITKYDLLCKINKIYCLNKTLLVLDVYI